MKAGFARVNCNPPLGTKMMGFGNRDMEKGCTGVHDDIHVRALYMEQGDERVLVLAYDMCFIGREETKRFKTALRRELGLEPHQVLTNASHSHVGPAVGKWYNKVLDPPEAEYIDQLEANTLDAARQAKESARDVRLSAGAATSKLPLSRRLVVDGQAAFGPSPEGLVYDSVPICLLRDLDDKPVCLLFSVSCHPSMISGWEISAEYPGAACDRLDTHLSRPCSLFLQGCGGDAKPRVTGEGYERWHPGRWDDVAKAGGMVADEVIGALDGLAPVEAALTSAALLLGWPLQEHLTRDEYQAQADDEALPAVRRQWATDIVARLDAGEELPTAVGITVQGIRIGEGVRIATMEGEATAGWGHFISDFYGSGVTFPLGYSNGEGLYLPTSAQIPQGGYEVVSYWEYGKPSGLAPGFEQILKGGLQVLHGKGID